MFKATFNRVPMVAFLVACASAMALVGCNGTGDTDGGAAGGDNAFGVQFVADGGAGATITITAPDKMTTGEKKPFQVTLLDPSGLPLGFVRVQCDTERGISILDPAVDGVAFEFTGANGVMSGLLGALTAGSWVIQCQAPFGFGLVVRKTIIIEGDIPAGFDGFPGAAGGTIGGGLLVEPPLDGLDGIAITSLKFTDAGGETTNGPIDTLFGGSTACDTDNDGVGDSPEPFAANVTFSVSVTNGVSTQSVLLESIEFTVVDGRPSNTLRMPITVNIAADGTGTITGNFIEVVGSTQFYVGSSDTVIDGSWPVNVDVRGTTQDGTPIAIEANITLTLRPVDNC